MTWFVPDVLGAFALDVPAKTLYMSPALDVDAHGAGSIVLPMFFPAFWATVTAATDGSGAGNISVAVTKAFGSAGDAVTITRIVAQPIGRPTSEAQVVALNVQ